jgi:hypothetical protein
MKLSQFLWSEAGYAKLPCVAISAGSVSEVVEHGSTGILEVPEKLFPSI